MPIYLIFRGAAISAALPLLLMVSLGVTLGTFIGIPVLGRIPESAYRALVGVLLLALGSWMFAAAV